MPRGFVIALVSLTAAVAFIVGLTVARSAAPVPVEASVPPVFEPFKTEHLLPAAAPVTIEPVGPGLASFADVADRLNPAVVNIKATSRGGDRSLRRSVLPSPEGRDLFERSFERERNEPRRGTGTGFVIDAAGFILTNHHVIDGADRITVRLVDGRSLAARIVGSDPDTDVALIKVDPPPGLVAAPLGDSDSLRVGEWVCAIGNPLAYEHTVTVGVVSFVGRKLYESSLDRYIQTDAAINLGNSGGPLINTRGEVIGINAAISSRANDIGFAVPINQARDILPQLKASGRVARGYIGVALRDIDPDIQVSLRLGTGRGVLVEDVTAGSPAWRSGIRAYDVIVGLDRRAVTGSDEILHDIASRLPGSVATFDVDRDGRSLSLALKLAERPARGRRRFGVRDEQGDGSRRVSPGVGMVVREMDQAFSLQYRLADHVRGVVVAGVDPVSPAFEADIERDQVVLEVNRQSTHTLEDYLRLTDGVRPGDVLAIYLYDPQRRQHQLRTVRIEER